MRAILQRAAHERNAGRSDPIRQPLLLREVREPRDGALEVELYGVGWAMALLPNDHLGLSKSRIHVGLPLEVLFGSGARLAVLEIVLFTEHEHDDVGVLLDGA